MPTPLSDNLPNFNGEVRLFPLSDLVMLPSNLLPLHIFESRYREMLEDAMQGDQLIAMATLLPGFEDEYYTRAPISPVVCIGRVTDYHKTDSGTYNLMLLGLARAEIQAEIEPVRSFRRAKVKLLGEFPPDVGEADKGLGSALAKHLRASLPAAEQLVEYYSRGELSLASLTDVAAFHLPLPTEVKLELLAEADHLARAELLLTHLSNPTKPARVATRFPIDFSDN
jgi:Lon protease-like protein